MFKKTLSTHALAALLLVGGVSVTQTSCTQNQQKEVSQESDEAYNDFKGFVDQMDAKATGVANETQADYERETAQMKADFDAKVAAVDRYADQYDDQRRQEIEQLRTRYTTAYDNREAAWRNRAGGDTAVVMNNADASTSTAADYSTVGKYYTPTRSYSTITPANIPAVYQRFTADIKKNEDRYDIDDWRNINADWKRLNARKDELDPQLSGDAKREIAKQKAEYAALKSYDKSEARVAQGASAVENTAKDVAHGAKEVGKDVGHGAKEVGKDIGHGAAKVGKKVGGAVKDVFDGKDKDQ